MQSVQISQTPSKCQRYCPLYFPLAQMNGFLVLQLCQLGTLRSHVAKNLRGELSKLVSHHIFGDRHLVVDLAIVHRELETDEAGEDGGGSCLRLDRLGPLTGLRSDDR